MSERTEEATPRRRSEARQKGQVSKSVEVNSAAILLAAFVLIRSIGPFSYEMLNSLMKRSFTAISSPELTLATLYSGAVIVALTYVQAIGPFLITLLGVGVISNIAQVGFLFSQEALKPDLNRISPLNGFKRLFSEHGIVELAKSSLKIIVIGYIIFITLRDNYSVIFTSSQMSLSNGLTRLFGIGYTVGMRSVMTMMFVAAIDFLFQRYAFNKKLRMSKQEIREEMKRYENPQLKARIRARQRQLAMNRMMSAVPEADVIITNPTHIAVALQYKRGETQVPKVVAKGQNLIAEKIKAKAQEHHIPLMENKPLARTLFHSVEVGEIIPVELYNAVAEVLAFVYRLKSLRRN